MSLSRVLRGMADGQLKRVSFLDFGAPLCEESGGEGDGDFAPFSRDSEPSGEPDDAAVPQAAADVEVQIQQALERGRQEGRRQAGEELDRAASALGRAMEEISRLRESLLTSSSQDMLRLVLTISQQVIGAEVTVGREVVLATIERALKAAVRSDSYHIKVHPDELDLVRERKPLFLASVAGLKNITLEADPAVAPGGCLVESELGEVDATIDTQLEEIRRTLLEALEKG